MNAWSQEFLVVFFVHKMSFMAALMGLCWGQNISCINDTDCLRE